MTAIVSVMNKHAAALAADSAVTYTSYNKSKVLNCANKIFNLSKYEPVGIAVYSNATLMGTPWDLIIKLYRKELGGIKKNTLKEYVVDFLEFLKRNSYFCSGEKQKGCLTLDIKNFYDTFYSQALDVCEKKFQDNYSEDQFLAELEKILINLKTNFSKLEKCPEFKNYSFEDFQKYASESFIDFKNHMKNELGLDLTDKFMKLLSEAYYTAVTCKHKMHNHTGLVFCGYGDSEIFPRLIPVIVEFAFDNRLIWHIDEPNGAVINDYNQASICPFAQTDVMMNILKGISPNIMKRVCDSFDDMLAQYSGILADILQNNGIESGIVDAVRKAPRDQIQEQFMKDIEGFINTHYVKKLLDTVEYLEIGDLSNLAESLIDLTGLNKRMTSVEETVGGPVDVAVISKIDGFIWIKRKHYFEKELNQQFFERYNR